MSNVRMFKEIEAPHEPVLPDGRRWALLLDFPQALTPWPGKLIGDLASNALRVLPTLLAGMPTPVESVTAADIDLDHRPELDEDGADPGALVAIQLEDGRRIAFLTSARAETVWWWREGEATPDVAD